MSPLKVINIEPREMMLGNPPNKPSILKNHMNKGMYTYKPVLQWEKTGMCKWFKHN